MGAQLFSHLDKLVDSVFTRSDCTVGFMDRKWCNIQEVMVEFHSINEVVLGSEFYWFTTEYFMGRSRREMWATLGTMKRKLQWLKLTFQRRSNLKPWGTFQSLKGTSIIDYLILTWNSKYSIHILDN